MGRFDRKLPGEKDGERAPSGKRRKFEPVVSRGETGKTLNVVDKILRRNSEALIDVTKAIGKFEADVREGRGPADGAAGGGGGGAKKKGGAGGGKGASKGAAKGAKGKGSAGVAKPGAHGGRAPGGAKGGKAGGGGKGGGNTRGRADRPRGTKGGNRK